LFGADTTNMQAIVMLSGLTYRSKGNNTWIEFTKDGHDYKATKDADGIVATVEVFPSDVQSMAGQLINLLSAQDIELSITTNQKDASYTISIDFDNSQAGLIENLTFTVNASGVLIEPAITAVYNNIASIDAGLLYDAVKTLEPGLDSLDYRSMLLSKVAMLQIISVNTDGSVNFIKDGIGYLAYRDDDELFVENLSIPEVVRTLANSLRAYAEQIGLAVTLIELGNNQYRIDIVHTIQKSEGRLTRMSFIVDEIGNIVLDDSSFTANAQGRTSLLGAVYFEALKQLNPDDTDLDTLNKMMDITIHQGTTADAVVFSLNNKHYRAYRDNDVVIVQDLTQPVEDLMQSLRDQFGAGFNVTRGSLQQNLTYELTVATSSVPAYLRFRTMTFTTDAITGDIQFNTLIWYYRNSPAYYHYTYIGSDYFNNTQILFNSMKDSLFGADTTNMQAIVMLSGLTYRSKGNNTWIEFTKDGHDYRATKTGDIVITQEILPPAVISRLQDLEGFVASGYTVSITSIVGSIPARYSITISTSMPSNNALSQLYFEVDSNAVIQWDTLIAEYQGISADIDAHLVFDALRHLSPAPGDYEILTQFSKIAIHTIDQDNVITFAKDGNLYEAYRDTATGNVIVNEPFSPAVSAITASLRDAIGATFNIGVSLQIDGTYKITITRHGTEGIVGSMQRMEFNVHAETGEPIESSLNIVFTGRSVDSLLFYEGMMQILPQGTSPLDILILMSRITNIPVTNALGNVEFRFQNINYRVTRGADNQPIVEVI